jgi:putative ribosome biogenesis GTPase RsgA
LTNEQFLHGLIIKAQSGFFTVETNQGLVVCQLRGKLKQGRAKGDIAAIGDRVRVTLLMDGSGVIEEVEERTRAIVRLDPRPQGDYQQVLLANPDQAVFVFACAHPNPRLKMLDRFLVIAEKQMSPVVVVANKIDLVADPKEIFGLYETIGYRVLYTSTKTRTGIEDLKSVLAGKISAFAGPSGAGKSSLLNAMQANIPRSRASCSRSRAADTWRIRRAGSLWRCGTRNPKRSMGIFRNYVSLYSTVSSMIAHTPMNQAVPFDALWKKVKFTLNGMSLTCAFVRVKSDRR